MQRKIITSILILLLLIILILLGFFWFKETQPSKLEKAKENALSKTLKINQEGDALLVDEPEYQIVYLKKDGQFLISILKSPFEPLREKAEKKFREITQADKDTLCQMNVVVTTPSFANPDLAGKIFPLSFCPKSTGI